MLKLFKLEISIEKGFALAQHSIEYSKIYEIFLFAEGKQFTVKSISISLKLFTIETTIPYENYTSYMWLENFAYSSAEQKKGVAMFSFSRPIKSMN